VVETIVTLKLLWAKAANFAAAAAAASSVKLLIFFSFSLLK
jgi:hypothetical protein